METSMYNTYFMSGEIKEFRRKKKVVCFHNRHMAISGLILSIF